MSTPPPIPGLSREGFVPLRLLRRDAKAKSLAAFTQAYHVPCLLVVDVGIGAPEGNPDATSQSGPQLVTLFRSGKTAFRYLDEAGFLLKRPGNPFPQFVSVGRAANNDVVLAVETVSKLHGYVVGRDGRWYVTDFRSRNGTEVNGEPIESGQERLLTTGDRIRWGTQITTLFLTPQALYERARS